jgi:hypothetical protein
VVYAPAFWNAKTDFEIKQAVVYNLSKDINSTSKMVKIDCG